MADLGKIPGGRSLAFSDDGIVRLCFIMLIFLCFVTVMILVTPAPEGVTGVMHPEHTKMFVGPEKGEGQAPVLGFLPVLQFTAIMAFVASLIHLGMPVRRRGFFTAAYLLICLLAQSGVFFAFWTLYDLASEKGWAPMAGSFPFPTAIFIYGFYPALALYFIIYIVMFRTLVLPPETEAEFKKLLKEMENIPEAER